MYILFVFYQDFPSLSSSCRSLESWVPHSSLLRGPKKERSTQCNNLGLFSRWTFTVNYVWVFTSLFSVERRSVSWFFPSIIQFFKKFFYEWFVVSFGTAGWEWVQVFSVPLSDPKTRHYSLGQVGWGRSHHDVFRFLPRPLTQQGVVRHCYWGSHTKVTSGT